MRLTIIPQINIAPAMYQEGYLILASNMFEGTCIRMYPTTAILQSASRQTIYIHALLTVYDRENRSKLLTLEPKISFETSQSRLRRIVSVDVYVGISILMSVISRHSSTVSSH
jgi:hypothetical protein